MNAAKSLLSAKLEQLLLDYVRAGLAVANHRDGLKHYETVATISIDFCVCVNREDILFDGLFPLFVTTKREGIFLQKLEPFILGDKLTKIPPYLIQRLVAHYAGTQLTLGCCRCLS